jgi:cytochrome c oxidase assembly protein subunit 15
LRVFFILFGTPCACYRNLSGKQYSRATSRVSRGKSANQYYDDLKQKNGPLWSWQNNQALSIILAKFGIRRTIMNQQTKGQSAIIVWLVIVCVMVFAMVAIGGITRLTGSGLSMVDWRPIMGVIPPITEQAWLDTFAMYQQFPEYQKLNQGMTLEGFKQIFFWEYFHRILGRSVGLVFLFPFCFFWITKRLDTALTKKLLVAFMLGGLQGLMGWYMVMSGLVDKPHVSHYRLAAHLSLAFIIIGYISWIILDVMRPSKVHFSQGRWLAIGLLVLVCLQIVYGAFTAGTHAGFVYNTFPKMHDQWVADQVFAMSPLWINFLESHATIQFIHRVLGTVVLAGTFVFWLVGKNNQTPKQRKWSMILFLTVLAQYGLGVYTLVMVVPIAAASMHQMFACVVFLSSIILLHTYSRESA